MRGYTDPQGFEFNGIASPGNQTAWIQKVADTMALYKMNFALHDVPSGLVYDGLNDTFSWDAAQLEFTRNVGAHTKSTTIGRGGVPLLLLLLLVLCCVGLFS